MMRFRAFHPYDLIGLQLQGAQDYLQPLLDRPEYGRALQMDGLAFTGVLDGRVLGCAGILPQTQWRAIAWALLGGDIPPRCWPAIHRLVLRVIDEAHLRGYQRIEATIDPDFDAAIRWARMLGFRDETPGGMGGWGPDGKAHHLYASVRIEL